MVLVFLNQVGFKDPESGFNESVMDKRLFLVEEEDESQEPTNTLDPVDSRPRYFYIQNNEAYEFYSKVDGHKVFSEIEHDPECAILKQNIPEAPQEKSATVICPFKVNNNWSIQEYTEGKDFSLNMSHRLLLKYKSFIRKYNSIISPTSKSDQMRW